MKPRLEAAPLTDEDYEIFLQRWSELDNGRFFRLCRDADRRDAELMFVRESHWERETTSPLKWWFEDWPFPDVPPRLRTVFDAALYWWNEDRRQYLNLRRYALRIGGTTLDWPDWPEKELP